MNNVDQLFSSLKGLVKDTLNKNSKPTKPEYSAADMNPHPPVCLNDREEDGFLLVGETKSERMALRASQFNSHCGVLAPPTYSQVLPPDKELPTYRVAMERGMSMIECQSSAPPANTNNNNDLLISDVPFVLAPSLTQQYQINQHNNSSEDYVLRTFMWSKYDYDFSLERSCLRDYCDTTDATPNWR
ncbi:uncharacterized protein LOC121382137 [Gigantopelta aegis]|uniref:uncharacterized protein LOC121382137 n=1 Tax=Gigantopelta aegis TaxID=1735272 RepID=UPI001B88B030|nr:uncharacterized protein LOC121382137 [Gigantopelta aegis]XP_041367579.1 uncharacterized protein LOC121382137 [Gigantopelta aegis]